MEYFDVNKQRTFNIHFCLRNAEVSLLLTLHISLIKLMGSFTFYFNSTEEDAGNGQYLKGI